MMPAISSRMQTIAAILDFGLLFWNFYLLTIKFPDQLNNPLVHFLSITSL